MWIGNHNKQRSVPISDKIIGGVIRKTLRVGITLNYIIMGQGGLLRITNNTPYRMRKTSEKSSQMNDWYLPEYIAPYTSERAYVEFDEGFFTNTSLDTGETCYTLEGSNDGSGKEYWFEVMVRFRYINVDIKNMAARVLPATIPPQSPIIQLGWNHDGEVNFSLHDLPTQGQNDTEECQAPWRFATQVELSNAINEAKNTENGTNLSSNQSVVNLGLRVKENLANQRLLARSVSSSQTQPSTNQIAMVSDTQNAWLKSWMWQYQQFIGHKKFTDLILPGTHDSGTYDMVSFIGQPWTQCQNLSLRGQLEAGARVLDLRIGFQSSESGNERFILVHDTWRSETTVHDALEQVKGFCSANSGEVVLLDFHRFVDLDGNADGMKNELIGIVKNQLGNQMIGYDRKDETMNDFIASSGRIIPSWNDSDTRPAEFWPGVNQEWFNKQTKDELYAAMKTFYEGSTPSPLWSCCAVITPGFPHISPIQSLEPDLSLWFSPNDSWAQKSNIVSCDFIQTTRLAESLIIANLRKP